jgi:hypothetical protein
MLRQYSYVNHESLWMSTLFMATATHSTRFYDVS